MNLPTSIKEKETPWLRRAASPLCHTTYLKEYIFGNTRGGAEGVEGELVASTVVWGPVVLLGFGLMRSTFIIHNSQRPVPIM
eukprot:1141667-Pelagomonas_calceolata.AAC.1